MRRRRKRRICVPISSIGGALDDRYFPREQEDPLGGAQPEGTIVSIFLAKYALRGKFHQGATLEGVEMGKKGVRSAAAAWRGQAAHTRRP